ncbi:hypothetical protein [Synechococcus sp. CB0101]|uniref:hypothetical protein n=1 Tax=Synechococcus sp. CB0101 TaxID=232348 RepID=UPI00143CEE4A|nr:hypothetical protein [Synechococcus sp. CB0101]
MTNQPNRDLTQQAQELDDQQLEAVAGGFIDYPPPTRQEYEELMRSWGRDLNGH